MSSELTAAHSVSTARERSGWYLYDWANSAFPTIVITAFLGPYLGEVARRAADASGDVHPLGLTIPAGSIFPYTVSLSVALTVLVLPLVGAVADSTYHKKQLMAGCAYLGAAATTCLIFVTGDRYLLGVGLLLVANIAYGASIVVYNSFLPQLAPPDQRDEVSSKGWAFGYLGGGTLLALHVVAVLGKDVIGTDTETVARYCLASAGVWWAGFTTWSVWRLRNGAPRLVDSVSKPILLASFRTLLATIREARAYPITLAFLGAYLIYNDGIQTVIALAAVYGTDELGLSDNVLIPTILLVQFLAFGGALLLGALARRWGAQRTLLCSLALWAAIVAAAFVLPSGQVIPFLILGGCIGIVLGGSQALSRSLFSHLIPAGKEAEYFSLYEIGDRGTSWLGPLLFGLIYQLTDSYRLAIVSLIVFFVIGFIALFFVPVRRGIERVGNTPPARC